MKAHICDLREECLVCEVRVLVAYNLVIFPVNAWEV